jgi:sugar/nucleoside kinase (ribokinase family)
VSVLPDFFSDRIILLPSFEEFVGQVRGKAESGGGNLRGFAQKEIRGGNATNLALALSSLAVRTNLYVIGDRLSRAMTAIAPSNCKIKTIEGRPGYTTAFEFPQGGRRVNVMVSDVGDLEDFSGKELSKMDRRSITLSDCVALVNWSANKKGNELARTVFNLPYRKRRLNFLDTADLTGAESRIGGLVERILRKGAVDVLSLNENEARILARRVSANSLPKSYNSAVVKNVSESLQETLSVTIDLHTPVGSATSTGQETVWVDSFQAHAGIVTGAGDVWDAGDIVGHLIGLRPVQRLQFANACAYMYLKSGNAEPPTLTQITNLLKKRGISLD